VRVNNKMRKIYIISLVFFVAFLTQCSSSVKVTQPSSQQAIQNNESRPIINNVELIENTNGIDLIIEADSSLMYTAYSAETNYPNLIIEIPGAVPSDLPSWIESDYPLIKNVQIEVLDKESDKPLTRFTVALSHEFDYNIEHEENKLTVNFAPLPSIAGTKEESPAITQNSGGLSAINESQENSTAQKQTEEIKPATVVSKIIIKKIENDVVISILGDGKLSYKSFILDNPDRLIVDIKDTRNEVSPPVIPVDADQLQRVRTSQYKAEPEMISRVVFDLNYLAKFQMVAERNTLKVIITNERVKSLDEFVAEAAMEEEKEEKLEREEAISEEPQIPAKEPVAKKAPTETVEQPKAQQVPEKEVEQKPEIIPEKPVEEKEEIIEPQEEEEIIPAQGQEPITTTFLPQTIPGEEKEYKGHPVSLELRDADIRDVIHLFATITNLNFVIDPEVGGRITIYLKEVPWDQALDIILRNNGLGKIFENNVMRIATTGKLASEAQSQRALIEERRLAVPLDTMTRAVSYAKALELEKVVKKNLSARGDVIVDERTNTLIIKDIPDQIALLRRLIDTLDIPAKQVQIESRIVETTREVIQGLGIQWGFAAVADRYHGNTTSLVFPNSWRAEGASAGLQRFGIGQTPYAVNLPTQQAANTSLGFTFGNLLGSFNLDATLHLLENTNQARLLSRPQITTQNNIAGMIRSGYRIPVQTAVALGVVSVTYIDAALRLSVTPQITSDDTIIMDVEVSNDTPTGKLIGPNAEISTRSATSRLLVPDGGTAVIGGIIQMRDILNQQRTPLLHRIPILGWLFKNRNVENRNDEMIIFITPRILKY
jgi:type IV pilus secretin PilQ/predicted competence protein